MCLTGMVFGLTRVFGFIKGVMDRARLKGRVWVMGLWVVGLGF